MLLLLTPTFKKKRNYFVCENPGHYAPQCRNRQKINDNPYKPEANLAEADGIIVVVISQECEQMGGKL